MYIANVIVKSRAFLAEAEYHYRQNHKGMASKVLSNMGAFLHKELPGITTEPDVADPETKVETSKEATEIPDSAKEEKPAKPEQTSQ